VSYTGVRTLFNVRPALARLWFLILPCVVYVLGGMAIAVVLLISYFTEADTSHPLTHTSATMTFQYPGNWFIDTDDDDYHPDSYVMVQAHGLHDAVAVILHYPRSITLDEAEIIAALQRYRNLLGNSQEREGFSTWGEYRGRGKVFTGLIDDTPHIVRAFLAELPDSEVLEVTELWSEASTQEVRPGFDQIESSMRTPRREK
jgi:hypothetical protein